MEKSPPPTEEHKPLLALEVMRQAYRVLSDQPDKLLQRSRLGRAHHRILYLVARHPDCSVTEICERLRVTRQAANAPLRELARKKLIRFRASEADSRVKLTSLSAEGARLERALNDSARRQFAHAFDAAGPAAEAGWFAVMQFLAQVPESGDAPAPPQRSARRARAAGSAGASV